MLNHTENDLLPLSALQHLIFCERQCALIHNEQQWAENRLTTEGNLMHSKAHSGDDESRPGVRITRGMPVRSLALGLSGVADIVEFHSHGAVVPVEYKRGRPKQNACDEVQLCAQALCVEEMLQVSIPKGQLFYGQKRRRHEIEFDEALRSLTRETAARLHQLIDSGRTPPAIREPKCDACSLIEICMPDAMRLRGSTARWFSRQLVDD